MHAVSRLLEASLDAAGPSALYPKLVCEARDLFGAPSAALLAVDRRERVMQLLATDPHRPPTTVLPLDLSPALAVLIDERGGVAFAGDGADAARALTSALGFTPSDLPTLLLPLRARDATEHVLLLQPVHGLRQDLEVAAAFAAAASAALAQLRLAREQAGRTAEQAALARAAKTLNETGLDLPAVLQAICHEARAILDGDNGVVYSGDPDTGLTIEACVGLPAQSVGRHLALGEGLSGRVMQADRAMLTNDYQRAIDPRPGSMFDGVQSCVAVPLHWDGEPRGVLSVGFSRARPVSQGDLALLDAFGGLASAASRNASAAVGLALAARTDTLTGCLNRGALEDALRHEVARAERTGRPLSLMLLDLDEFKQINEQGGHLVGDEVLRRVGRALRSTFRPYDIVGRYGGDEFAVLICEADEACAVELAARAIDTIARTTDDLPSLRTGATAGIAERLVGQNGHALMAAADRALLFGKQELGRGLAVRADMVPQEFGIARGLVPGQTGRAPTDLDGVTPFPAPAPESWSGSTRLQRRTRQLMTANALGARLSRTIEVDEICEAVVDILYDAFGYFVCSAVVIRDDDYLEVAAMRGAPELDAGMSGWTQPREAGVIGRALRERRVVLVDDITLEPGYTSTPQTTAVRSELVAPVWAGDELWGALNCEEISHRAFDADDAHTLQTLADMMGSALRSALLFKQLERAHTGTTEALTAALAAKDAATALHARSIVAWADEVGVRLGLGARDRRDLRYGAIFHDIGKIAVPEEILNKPGPLHVEERELLEQYSVVGEQILTPAEFLHDVLPIVRHEHERWDGHGYPDGLAGERIPLGARIVFVCDAYHAMTSDRPYRPALDRSEALAELRAGAGSQFDPVVVATFLTILDEELHQALSV